MKGGIFKHSFNWNCRSQFGGRVLFLGVGLKNVFCQLFVSTVWGTIFELKGGNFLQKIFLIVVPKIGEFWVLSQFCNTYSTFLFWLSWGTMRLFCELGGYSLWGCSVSLEAIGWLDDYCGRGCVCIFWLLGQYCKCFQKRADFPKFTLIYKGIKKRPKLMLGFLLFVTKVGHIT